MSWRPLMFFIVCTEVLLRRTRRFFILYYPVPSWSVLLYWNGQNLCVHQLLRLYLRVRDCVQVRYRHIRQAEIPARVVLGTAVFCDQSNQYLVYEFPFCAMHMRVSSVSLPYLQNRLPSLIISAILAQYSSLCDHLVLQFNPRGDQW